MEEAKAKAKPNIVRRLDKEAWNSSTKVEAVLEELRSCETPVGACAVSTVLPIRLRLGSMHLAWISGLQSACVKTIIFSQFTTFLDLLEWRLQRAGIRYVCSVWSMCSLCVCVCVCECGASDNDGCVGGGGADA
jgi:DNA repair protein RAD16